MPTSKLKTNTRARARVAWPSRGLGVVLSLIGVALVLASAHLPRENPYGGEERPFPLHLDEYLHWGMSAATAEQGRLNVTNPFSGAASPPPTIASVGERGFHIYAAAFHLISGLDWMTIVLWTPIGVALLLASATWLLTERWGAAPAALLFVAAIPSTLRFLGYAYFVPIGFALPLVVLGFHFLLRWQEGGSPLPFLLLTLGLWPIHAMAAGLLGACALVMAAQRAFEKPRAAIAVVLVVGGAGFIAWPIYGMHILSGLQVARLSASVDLLKLYSLPAAFFAAAGATALLIKSDPTDRRAGLTLALAMVALELVMLVRVSSNRDPFVLYDRSFIMVALLAAILGGVGLAWLVRPLERSAQLSAWPKLRVAVTVLVLLVPLAVSQSSWATQAKLPTYYALTEAQESAYRSVAGRVDTVHAKAIVDGISGLAFTDITGVRQYAPRGPSDSDTTPELEGFFRGKANDTAFLVARSITLVVTNRPVENPDLTAVAPGVYELAPTFLEPLGVTPTTTLRND